MVDDIIRGEVSLDGLSIVRSELALLKETLKEFEKQELDLRIKVDKSGTDAMKQGLAELRQAITDTNAEIWNLTKTQNAIARERNAALKAGSVAEKEASDATVDAIGRAAAFRETVAARIVASEKAIQAAVAETAEVVEKAETKKRTAIKKTAEEEEAADLARQRRSTRAKAVSPEQVAREQAQVANNTELEQLRKENAQLRVTPRISPQQLEAMHTGVDPARPPPALSSTAVPAAPAIRPAAPAPQVTPRDRSAPRPQVVEARAPMVDPRTGEMFQPVSLPNVAPMLPYSSGMTATELAAQGTSPRNAIRTASPDPTPGEYERAGTIAQLRMIREREAAQRAATQATPSPAMTEGDIRKQINDEDVRAREAAFRHSTSMSRVQRETSSYYDQNVPYRFGSTGETWAGRSGSGAQGDIEAEYRRAMNQAVPDRMTSGTEISRWVSKRNQDAAAARNKALTELNAIENAAYEKMKLDAEDAIQANMKEVSQHLKEQYGVSNVVGAKFIQHPDLTEPAIGESATRAASSHRQAHTVGMRTPSNFEKTAEDGNLLERAEAWAAANPDATEKDILDRFRISNSSASRIKRDQAKEIATQEGKDLQEAIALEAQNSGMERAMNFEANRGTPAISGVNMAEYRAPAAEIVSGQQQVQTAAERKQAAIENQRRLSNLKDANQVAMNKLKEEEQAAKRESAAAVAAFNKDKDDPFLEDAKNDAAARFDAAKMESLQQEVRLREARAAHGASITETKQARTSYNELATLYGPAIQLPSEGRGGRTPRPQTGVLNSTIYAADADEAVGKLEKLAANVDQFKAGGGRVNVSVVMTGELQTEEKLIRIGAAARAIDEKGTVRIKLETVGDTNALAQMEAINNASAANARNNVSVSYDDQAEKRTAERAAAQVENDRKKALTQANNIGRFGARMDAQRSREEAQEAAEVLRQTKEADKALAEADKIAEEAQRRRMAPFTSTANTHSRSVLGVPAALAGPAALGLGVAAGIFEAANYQTEITTTGNQTNLDARGIAMLDQSVRGAQTGSPNTKSLEQGFKNITDLGYTAADAQKIFSIESKAATAAGSDQAAVMLAVTSSMKDYNATADDAEKYTNATVEAARLANSSFETWANTTRRATAIAAAYGVSLQDVDAMLVALTRHGFNTAQANTQVAGLIQNIVAPTPAAREQIEALTSRTGIPLTTDFSQQGIQAKGMIGILKDLGAATQGDEALIKSLIPALRGGQAALILTTTATEDLNNAQALMGETISGAMKPVEEGFTRIQQTTGYKFGQFLKELKFDAIDIGGSFLPMANTILNAFNMIPSGAQQTIVQLIAMGLAAKTVAIGYDVVQASAARFVASTTAQALASQAAAAALKEEAAGLATVATASAAASSSTAAGAVATGTGAGKTAAVGAETVIAAELALGEVELAAGFMPKLAAGLSAAVKAAGPIAIGVAIVAGVEHFIMNPIANNIISSKAQAELDNADPTKTGKTSTGLPMTSSRFNDNINDVLNEATRLDPNDPASRKRLQEIGKYLDEQVKQSQQFIKDYKPGRWDQVGDVLGIDDYNEDYLKGLALKTQDARGRVAEILHPSKGDPAFEDDQEPPKVIPPSDAEIAAAYQHQDQLRQRVAELIAKGAPPLIATQATYGATDFDTAKVVQATRDLAEWQKQYDAVQKAANNAQTTFGAVDITKGLFALGGEADKLKKANDELTKVGSATPATSGLATIAMQFKGITDAEKEAAQAFNGYMLTFNETDRRAQQLEAFKKQIEAQAATSQRAVQQGTATDQDREFLKNVPNILGNLNKELEDLHRGQIPDLIGGAKNLPDLEKADKLGRDLVLTFGGGKELVMNVSAKTEQAKSDIQAVVDGPWTAWITAKVKDQTGSSPPGGSTTTNEVYGVNTGVPLNVPGQFKTYSPISPAEWASIVPSNSPMAGLETLTQLNVAARQAGVDPRYLASFFAQEGNFSTVGGAGAWQVGAKNPGGLKYIGQAGARSGPSVPVNEMGPGKPSTYAAFDSYGDYFQSMLSSITSYQSFRNGDAAGVAGDWTKGPGMAGSPDYIAAGEAKLKYYREYLANQGKFAGTGPSGVDLGIGGPGAIDYIYGVGDPGNRNRGAQRWVNPIGPGMQTGYGNMPFQANSTHAGTGAIDLDANLGTPVYASAAGVVKQSGYDTGYGNTALIDYGNGVQARYGHFAQPSDVKVGDQVKAGQVIGQVGSTGNSTGPHLHFEVTVNGKQVDPREIGFNFDDPSKNGLAPVAGRAVVDPVTGKPVIGSTDATGNVDPRYRTNPFLDLSAQARQIARIEQGLDLPGQQALVSRSQSFGQYAKDFYENRPENFGNKGQADDQANRATLNFTIALGTALEHVHQLGAATSADFEKILATAGDMGPVTVQWVKAQEQVTAATKANKEAQLEIKQIQDQQFQTQQSRAYVDRDIAATRLIQQRNDENADISRANAKRKEDRRIEDERTIFDTTARNTKRGIQTDTYTEDDRFTNVQRVQQDKERALQFAQQVQATTSQNELTDLEKRQRNTVYQQTAEEALLARQQRAAPTNQAAAGFTAQLAFAHERDLAQRDSDKKAIDDIQLRIREEAKKASLDTYNLQTETLLEQRKHQDIMHGIELRSRAEAISEEKESVRRSVQDRARQRSYEDESVRIDALRLRHKRADEDDAIALATKRALQDEADAKQLHDLQLIIDNNNKVIQEWGDYQQQLDGVLSNWKDIATYAGDTAASAALLFASVPGSTVTNIPKRARGGSIAGFAIVGDGPNGEILPTTELVHAPGMDVTPISKLVAQAVAPAFGTAQRGSSSQTVVHMPINVQVDAFDDVEAQLRREFEAGIIRLRTEFAKKNIMAKQRVGK